MNTPILSYVYKLTHILTNQYYFGFRSANTVPANLDLGIKYFSSSKTIKEIGFNNFKFEIIAEFFKKEDAYDFECELIRKHIDDPLNLNKALKGKLCPIRKFTTSEHKSKLSNALRGKKLSKEAVQKRQKAFQETLKKMSKEERSKKFGIGGKNAQLTISKMTKEERSKKFGHMKGKSLSDNTKFKISEANIGKKMSNTACEKMSNAKKGKSQSPEAIFNRTKNFKNGGNPRAMPISINGISYSCKKEAAEALGLSKYKLKQLIICQQMVSQH